MKIIHVSDLHLVKPDDKVWGVDPLMRFDACLADISRHHADAEFCVISGDLTDRGEIEAYELVRERLANFPLETHLLIGNHDIRESFFAVFPDAPRDSNGFVQHHITRGGFSFFFLDTLKGPPSSAGLYCERRKQWLAGALSKSEGPPVLFMHHPFFPIAHPLMDRIKLDDAEAFADLVAPHAIRHVFFGHAHRTVSGQYRGISYSAPPSLAHQLPLVAGSVETVYSEEPPIYSVAHFSPEQTVVHMDAFLDRQAANMAKDAERDDWF
ncbi:MAG: phosphodiesterase [Parvibaculaceae bacterium]